MVAILRKVHSRLVILAVLLVSGVRVFFGRTTVHLPGALVPAATRSLLIRAPRIRATAFQLGRRFPFLTLTKMALTAVGVPLEISSIERPASADLHAYSLSVGVAGNRFKSAGQGPGFHPDFLCSSCRTSSCSSPDCCCAPSSYTDDSCATQ
jgi:hypothetical protein